MPKSNRRQFLKTSAAASLVFGAPAILKAGQSPNETLGGCVIGVNSRGNSHIGGWLADKRTQITAIVDVDEVIGQKRCDAIEKKQGKRPQMFVDMRRAIDATDVDFISTATPNHWHALTAIWAMQAGKDVYVEKPVSHNVYEGTSMIAAARKYERMCQVGTQCRSSKAVQDAIQFIQEGGIGNVTFARGLCYKRRKSIGALGNYQIPKNINFDLWSGPAQYTDPKLTRKRFHYDWHWQRLYGNGDLGNQGPHQTDIARWGLGLDRHPNRIVTYGGRLGYQAEQKNPNYIDAGDTGNTEVSIYDYGDKCIVFETRGLDVTNSEDDQINRLFDRKKGNVIGVIFYGSEGYVVQKTYSHCTAYDKDLNVIREFRGGDRHFRNFIDGCISRNMEDLNADVREGHLSASISHLGNISYYVGAERKMSIKDIEAELQKFGGQDDNRLTLQRTVAHLQKNNVDLSKYPLVMGPVLDFDSDREIFTNHDSANAWLTRDYRAPYVVPKAADV